MIMPKTLYFLRHGSTGADGRFIGSTDLPVAPAARATLRKSGRALLEKNVGAVFCSPMLRCRQSFDALSLDRDVEYLDDLREIDFGEWENKSFDEITAAYPDKVCEWAEWSEGFSFPEGERISNFLQRIRAVREKIELHPAQSILVVSHGGIIRHLICSLLGLPSSSYLLFDIKAGLFSTIELHSEGGVLTSLNTQ